MKSFFQLNPEITYLNHGAFGACPKIIFEKYQQLQRELEFEPTLYIQTNSPKYLVKSRMALAQYIGCEADDVYFTPNPTVAVNTIMKSLQLNAGDEILTTNHEYGAMDRTWHFYEKESGVKYVQASITLPIISKEQMIEDFWAGYSPKTKVIFINHISSATALIFPVKEICEKAKTLGLITIIDGAHVPGHIDLNINFLDVDFYTGTCHKWMLTPKGSSFLYVRKSFQAMLKPLVVSWGYESLSPSHSRFLDYHEHQGTRDIAAYLTLPTAINFLEDNHWKTLAKKCNDLILSNYQSFCKLLGTSPICPITPEFLGQMCSIPINTTDVILLKNKLYDDYKIQIPVMNLNGKYYLRISLNAYNNQDDLEILRAALTDIIATTNLILL